MKIMIYGLNQLQNVPPEMQKNLKYLVYQALYYNLEKYRNIVLNNFDSGLNPRGEAWTPLNQATLAKKSTDRILYEMGNLRDGFVFEVHRSGLNTANMIVDNTNEVAPFHQYGSRFVPQREILDSSDAQLNDIIKICEEYLASLVLP